MGVHFGSLGNHFGASFLWIQKATLRRRHPSFTAIVFECSEEVRFESLGSNFGANFLWVQKATLGTTSCRPNKIIHPQPLGSAAGGVAPFVYIYMVPSQNCVWNVPRCSGRMERRGFVTGLVPDLWSVMKYRLYINKYIYIYIYTLYVTYIIYISRICTLKLLLICTTSFLYTCSTQVCLAWLVLVH